MRQEFSVTDPQADFAQVYAGQPVLVTGADGFIGSHLVERLVRAGARVRAFTFYNSWNSLGWLADVPESIRTAVEVFPGDIRDAERVQKAVAGQSFVFHLASLIAIPYSYSAPRSYVDTNIGGTLNVLEACRRSTSLIRLVHTSTSEVYGTARSVPITECHPLTGQSPYAASKIGADKMAESYHLSFQVPMVTARPFNTFGPRQTARAVIPTILSQLLNGCDALRLGTLTPTRDFNYVTDTAEAFLALGACAASDGQTLNIGSGREWSIGQVAELAMEVCGRQVPILLHEDRLRPPSSEVERLLADNSQCVSLTGWQPEIDFREGLARTANWIRSHLDRFDSNRYSQ
ncbi:GDP-mannose 4,6-dehydratase [Azospirillum argentinense]|uniref:GDP-mannose 4,6-dehydratase n=1 Tax=Azospirillum argentinense TaxID=2970906 RepID=UPI0032DEDED8